jgi:hypothetical protein
MHYESILVDQFRPETVAIRPKPVNQNKFPVHSHEVLVIWLMATISGENWVTKINSHSAFSRSVGDLADGDQSLVKTGQPK